MNIEPIMWVIVGGVVIIYIGICLFVAYNNRKCPQHKLLYPWEVPEPDETEFDEV